MVAGRSVCCHAGGSSQQHVPVRCQAIDRAPANAAMVGLILRTMVVPVKANDYHIIKSMDGAEDGRSAR
jgi:hypothetical protein